MAVISYKCPNCDGDLKFSPTSGDYHCEYCNSHFSQAQLEQLAPDLQSEEKKENYDQDSIGGENEKAPGEGGVLYTCPSCGAEIVTEEETTASTFCYYCHNPVVLTGKLDGKFTPDLVIPFRVDQEKAKQHFAEFVGKKKFVPKGFFSHKSIENLSGVYFPFWRLKAKTRGDMTAEGCRERTYRSGQDEITETKIYDVQRAGTVNFDNLEYIALKKANRKLVENVLPFDMTSAEPFHVGYLSGFQAEKRDMERTDFEKQAQEEVKEYTRDILRDSITGYTRVNVRRFSHQLLSEKWSYTLCPIWTITYNKDGEIYYYSVNGQTGKTCGVLPVNKTKLFLTSLGIGILAFALAVLGGIYLW
ncbi:MAG: TFIIB-type zinc ribbon-containing protein [Roseburia sp.]